MKPRHLIAAVALTLSCLAASEPLPGTQPLTAQGDLASQMVEGIDRFLLKETEATVAKRAALWAKPQDPAARRQRLAKMIGAVDKRERGSSCRSSPRRGRSSGWRGRT